MSMSSVLELQHGVARFGELGLSKRRVRVLVSSGALEKVGHGTYALPNAAEVFRVAALRDATVSCVSALRARAIDVPGDGTLPHLSVPPNRGTSRSRFGRARRHYEDVAPRDGGRLASSLDAYDRAASCLSYLDAVALLDLTRQERVRGREVPGIEEILARVARRSPRLARQLAVDVDPSARSFRESAPRLILRAAGLATVAGAVVPTVGEVDLLVEGCIVVEVDGMRYHSGRTEFRGDRRRDRRLTHLGFLVLRYAWEDADPDRILRDVLDLLATCPPARPFSRRVGESLRADVRALRTVASDPAHAGSSAFACAALEADLARSGVTTPLVRTALRPG